MKLSVAALAAACTLATPVVAGSAAPPVRAAATPTATTYTNPVLDENFADPTVLRVGTTTYAYATGAVPGGPTPYIRMSHSTDLIHWSGVVTVMPRPAWATGETWAPDVIADPHPAGGYLMYFAAQADPADPVVPPGSGKCLGVAVARSPLGPFTPRPAPLACAPGFVDIDPMAFRQPDGRYVLYWGSAGQPIRMRPLSADLLSFAPGSTPVDVIGPVAGDKYAKLIEGAWVLDHGPYRYLFMSGSRCCAGPDDYAVTVARRQRATNGPWVRYAGGDHGAILKMNGTWQAPGHNAVFVDGAGTYWIMYHARRPGQTKRVLMMDPIAWVDGWPRIAGDSPSTGPVRAPVP